MRTSSVLQRIDGYLQEHANYERMLQDYGRQLTSQQTKLDECIAEQTLTVQCLQALQDVRPILASVSSEQSIALANQCLEFVFQTEDKLYFSEDDSRFYIKTPLGDTDLITANGGGYRAVISFIFTIFLLIKGNHRRFLLYDEQFTMLDDEALSRFIPFLRNLCKDLNIDCLFITHDARINIEDVDSLYYLDSGRAKKLK